jgi:predicted transcriptional regulator
MYRRVNWLTAMDYPILQFLADLDGYWIKPASMCLNLPYGRQAVASHCATLAEHGLVERHTDVAAYRIVEKGRAYLQNELSVEDLQEPSDENEDKDEDEDGDENG